MTEPTMRPEDFPMEFLGEHANGIETDTMDVLRQARQCLARGELMVAICHYEVIVAHLRAAAGLREALTRAASTITKIHAERLSQQNGDATDMAYPHWSGTHDR